MRHLTDGPKQDKFYEIEPQDIVIFITQKKKKGQILAISYGSA